MREYQNTHETWFLDGYNFVLWCCGVVVDELSIRGEQAAHLFHVRDFCTHFVRSMWVMFSLFAQLFRSLKPQAFADYSSVNGELYSVSTGPTITASFSDLTY